MRPCCLLHPSRLCWRSGVVRTAQSQHALSDKCRVCWETSSPRSSPPLVEYAGMPAVSSDILRDYRTQFLWQKTVLVWRSVQSCAFHPFQVFSSKVWIGTAKRSAAAWLVFVYGQVLFLNSICRLPILIKKVVSTSNMFLVVLFAE